MIEVSALQNFVFGVCSSEGVNAAVLKDSGGHVTTVSFQKEVGSEERMKWEWESRPGFTSVTLLWA